MRNAECIKQALRCSFVLLSAVFFLVGFLPAASAELVDRIIASVNNDVIALSDLRKAVAFNAVLGSRTAGRRLEAETLEGLINRKLLLQEAYRIRFVDVSGQDIADEIERLRKQLGTDEAFSDFLSRTGMTEPELSRMLGERLLVERFIEKKIGLFARVSREDAEQYFHDHAAEFKGRRFADVRNQITVRLTEQMIEQQLARYLAELRDRADIRINPLE